MRNVLILGATGATGQQLIHLSLEREHKVTALCRDPTKITIEHENLNVAKCNVFNKEDMLPHVHNADVVLSALGYSREGSLTGYAHIARIVSECSAEAGKKRAIFLHSWYSDPESRNRCDSFLMRNIVLAYMIKPVLDGMHAAEMYLATQQHLDYTVILPTRLGNGPITGKGFHTTDTEWFVANTGAPISRGDVARYMLDVVGDEASYRKIRAIGVDHESEVETGCWRLC